MNTDSLPPSQGIIARPPPRLSKVPLLLWTIGVLLLGIALITWFAA